MPSTLTVVPVAFKRSYLTYPDYKTLLEVSPNTGNIYAYRLNSIYDPDSAGVGTTAMGYSAMVSLYRTFRVVRCRVILRFGLVTAGTATVGFLPSLLSVAPSNMNQTCAEPNVISRVIQGNTGGAHSLCTIDKTFDLPKICGLTQAQYMNDMDFAHVAGANPARSVYGNVYFVGNSTTAQTIFFNIRLIYEVEMSEPYTAVSN